ncbi:hypothetical protein M501DRAFT_990732 [Patellaria atrata CBS 101060]|uniref:Uncharacterized protein n=1 Tax=Patellaria atrata CBS 101060 TaxID=1346257 RepID=A0A9P4SDP4_9PEZI|nr:hypothetical protein M501DRAFT_990732 [Patellaria atrata CBS 101060]
MVDQGIQNKAETQSESKEITPPGRKSLPKSTTPNRYHPYRRPNTKESSDRKEGPEDTSSVKPPRKSHKRVVSFGATVTESAISAELTTAPETTEECHYEELHSMRARAVRGVSAQGGRYEDAGFEQVVHVRRRVGQRE